MVAGVDDEIGTLDYSLLPRKRIDHKAMKLDAITELKNDPLQTIQQRNPSFLNKEKYDIFEPFSSNDWHKLLYVVLDTDSYGFLQFLPKDKVNHMKMTNGIINIIPREYLLKEYKNFGILNLKETPIDTLPIEFFIQRTFEKNIVVHKEQHHHGVIEELEKIYHIGKLYY